MAKTIKKNFNKKAARAVGRRFNLFSDDDSTNVSELQDVIEKLSEKVDENRGSTSSDRGLEGSIRTVKAKNEWFIEIKSEEGWLRSSAGSFALKDK
jgi:hypothetical protein